MRAKWFRHIAIEVVQEHLPVIEEVEPREAEKR